MQKWPLFVNKQLFWWSASITLNNGDRRRDRRKDIGTDMVTDRHRDRHGDRHRDRQTDMGIDIGTDMGTDMGTDIGTDMGTDIGTDHRYRPHGSGKLHQLLENPTCTPMSIVYPLQIRPVFVFVMIRG